MLQLFIDIIMWAKVMYYVLESLSHMFAGIFDTLRYQKQPSLH